MKSTSGSCCEARVALRIHVRLSCDRPCRPRDPLRPAAGRDRDERRWSLCHAGRQHGIRSRRSRCSRRATSPPVDLACRCSTERRAPGDRGRELFRVELLFVPRGPRGQGDGPSAATMNPKPRNFQSAAGWTNGPKITQMYKTLEEGIVRNGMASYSYIPPADRFAIIHYVRTFMPVSSRRHNCRSCRRSSRRISFREGPRSPGQSRYAVAEKKPLEESAAEPRSRRPSGDCSCRSGARRRRCWPPAQRMPGGLPLQRWPKRGRILNSLPGLLPGW